MGPAEIVAGLDLVDLLPVVLADVAEIQAARDGVDAEAERIAEAVGPHQARVHVRRPDERVVRRRELRACRGPAGAGRQPVDVEPHHHAAQRGGVLRGALARVLAEAQIAYRSPVLFGEPLVCGCRFAWVGRSSFGLEYVIRAEKSAVGESRVVADGSTVQVMFDLERQRISRVPADLVEMFERYEGRKIPSR